MKPLKPDDLLIRKTPVELDRWAEGTDASGKPMTPVRLERFQELEQTLRNNPIMPDPYIELARIYLNQARWMDAKRVLDRAADLFPSNEDVLYLREDTLVARSLQLLSHAEAEHRAADNVLTEKELVRARLDLNAVREKVCRTRLARHPERLELTIPLAEALEGLDRSEEAIDFLQKASADAELRSLASYKLGEIHERAGRVTEALSAYRRAALFRIPPAAQAIQLAALGRAAELALRHRMLDSASRYVEMLRQLEPQNPRWPQMAQEIVDLEAALQP
ncbi:MAG: tetratricopeptide repeat protein [Aureliella sp.]